MAQSCPVMSGHDEGVEMERAPSARPAGSAPRQRKHGKKRAAKPKARPHSIKEAVELLLDVSDRIPFRAVRCGSTKIWRNFEKKTRTADSAQEVLKHARWFESQLKPAITSRAWADTDCSKLWAEQCQRCTGARESKALILQLQCNAIDWNSVAEFWANERGCLAEEVAPGILAAAMVGGWSGERAAQEPVDPGVCEDGLEKWRCPEPVQDDGEADEDTSDAEQTADGVHAVWSHGAQDYGDASVHSETEKDEAFPGSPYASDIVHSPRQPGTPGIALSRASSIPPVAGMGLPALYTASSISAASVGIGGYDMFPLHGIHTTLPGIHTTAAGSAAYGPPGGCANVDAPGAFMLGGSAVGFSSLSTVGFSAPPAAGTGTTGTAVLQGSSFSALPGTYNASPWRSRPVASVAGDGFEELSLDMWSDSLKDSLWQCGQV